MLTMTNYADSMYFGIEDSPTGGQMYIYQSFRISWNVKPIDLMETQTLITSQQQKWKPIKIK